MSDIKKIIKDLEQAGVFVFLEKGQLKARSEESSIPETSIAIIKANKEEVIAYLKEISLKELATPIKLGNDTNGPLSYSQQGLWFLNKFSEGLTKYNMFALFNVIGDFDKGKAEQAITKLIERHSTLRTVYIELGDQPKQFILPHFNFEIDCCEVEIDKVSSVMSLLSKHASLYAQNVFDLKKDLSVTAQLLTINSIENAGTQEYLLININHLAADGWSLEIFVDEFQRLYDNSELSLIDNSIRYLDYAAWQKDSVQFQRYNHLSTFWKTHLEKAPLTHSLRKKTCNQSSQSRILDSTIVVDKVNTSYLLQLASNFELTPFMFMHSLVSLAISRASNTFDVVMGTSVANRHTSDIERLIGLFANTVAFRLKPIQSTIGEFFHHVKSVHQKVQAHQEAPFELIVEASGQEKHESTPLFQIMLVNNTKFGVNDGEINTDIKLKHSVLKRMDIVKQARFELNIAMNLKDGCFEFEWSFNEGDFEKNYIDNIANQVKNLADNLVSLSHNKSSVESISLNLWHVHTNETYEKLTQINRLSNPTVDQCLHQLVEEQVEKSPDKIALVFENESLTYAELNSAANRLANYLKVNIHSTEEKIAICLHRSLDIAVAELAVLKAGAAFVPIDPELPEDRITFILDEINCSIVLTHHQLISSLPLRSQLVVPMDVAYREPLTRTYSSINPELCITDDHLAYIIFTSGSTGTPKGVMVEHKNIVNQNLCEIEDFQLTYDSRVLHCISFSFDPSVAHMFASLIAGATVVFSKYIENVPTILEQQKISHASFPASVLAALEFKAYPDLKLVTAGAEKCPRHIAVKWSVGRRFMYTYGPTEATVAASWGELSSTSKPSSLGSLLDNVYAYVVDEQMNIVPYGFEGELLIGGAGVSRGYLNDETKTSISFIDNPFSAESSNKLYCTGDLVIQHEQGELEFVGRLDTQVKLNGYRLELSEIEHVIQAVFGVARNLAIIYADQRGFESLCVYVELENENPDEEQILASINRSCIKTLPKYMVPTNIICVRAWPLTSNGKIDKEQLPKPASKHSASINTQATTEHQLLVNEIWSKLLKMPPKDVSIEDNFFELGGDSILSIQMVSALNKAGFKISVNDIFENPTIKAIAENLLVSSESSIASSANKESFDLLPISSLFVKDSTDLHHFNQSASFSLPFELSHRQLEQILMTLCTKHEMLRSGIKVNVENINTHINDPSVLNLATSINRYSSQCANYSDINDYIKAVQSSFSFSDTQLIKFLYIENKLTTPLLVVIVHHFIIDGVSWRMLVDDLDLMLCQFSNQQVLDIGYSKNTYADVVQLLKRYSDEGKFEQDALYWQGIATTSSHQLSQQKQLGCYEDALENTLIFDKVLTQSILSSGKKRFKATPDELLLSALAMGLHCWTDGTVFKVNIESHGRQFFNEHIDTIDTLGWFSNVYPVIIEAGDSVGVELFDRVKESLRSVPNDGIAYGAIKKFKGKQKNGALLEDNNADISFNYLGQLDSNLNTQLLSLIDSNLPYNISSKRRLTHAISLNCFVQAEQLNISLSVDGTQFNKQQLDQLVLCIEKGFNLVVQLIEANQAASISKMDFPLCKFEAGELAYIVNQNKHKGTSIESIFPASKMQVGLLLESEIKSGVYCSQLAFRLSQLGDLARFIDSWKKLIDKHQVLRTGFCRTHAGNTFQVVAESCDWKPVVFDISNETKDKQNDLIRSAIDEDNSAPFPAHLAPMMRLTIWRLDDSNYQVLWSHHHAIMDGWCLGLIFDDLSKNYQEIDDDGSEVVPFENYLEWSSKQTTSEEKAYWHDYLKDVSVGTLFTKDDLTEPAQVAKELILSTDVSSKVFDYCRKLKVTPSIFMQCVIGYVLGQFTNQKEIIFGTTVSGRPPEVEGVEKIVGLFINTIPTKVNIDQQVTCSAWIKSQQLQQQKSLNYSNLPYIDILDLIPQSLRKKLFDVLVVIENYPLDKDILNTLESRGLNVSSVQITDNTSYGLTINVSLLEQITFRFSGCLTKSVKEKLERLISVLSSFIQHMVEQPLNAKVVDIPLLSSAAFEKTLSITRGSVVSLESAGCIHHQFERIVSKYETQVAVDFQNKQLTYKELDDRANQLAHFLLSHTSVAVDEPIGICLPRSIELVISILAVMKTGAAYMPIDPDSPEDRLTYTLENSGVKQIISVNRLVNNFHNYEGFQHYLNDENTASSIGQQSKDSPKIPVNENNLVCVLYTSGSTGRPKGVMIDHIALHNRINWIHQEYGCQCEDKVLQKTPITFDVSVFEFILPLVTGATLVLAKPEGHKDPDYLCDLVKEKRITKMHFVPSMLNSMLSFGSLGSCSTLKQVFCSGEQLLPVDVERFYQQCPNIQLHNWYGPTEAAEVSYWDCENYDPQSKNVPIGKPIHNTELFVFSHTGQLLPIGEVGELYVGGIALARGYINQEELTNERFINHEFIQPDGSRLKKRLYRTGDLTRFNSAGELEYIGRIDHQVKIRGYRIELGEIEVQLSEIFEVQQAAVIAEDVSGNDKRLIAFVVMNEQAEQTKKQLIEALSERLPDYMLPEQIVVLEKLPLTTNNKVDRLALSEFVIESESEVDAPSNQTESQLRVIMGQILSKDVSLICVNKSFFELGGHSLHAIKLVIEVQKSFNIEFTLRDAFNIQSIRALSNFITNQNHLEITTNESPIEEFLL